MPIIVKLELPHEPDQPGGAGGGDSPEADPITPERLTKVIRNLETGFYDSPEVRHHIACRVREELGP